jgi:hypothetical protein
VVLIRGKIEMGSRREVAGGVVAREKPSSLALFLVWASCVVEQQTKRPTDTEREIYRCILRCIFRPPETVPSFFIDWFRFLSTFYFAELYLVQILGFILVSVGSPYFCTF